MTDSNFKSIIQSIIAIIIAAGIATGIAFAGSVNGYIAFAGMPLFALLIIIAFAIQWLAFIPSYILRTEKFFDLTGALTYITVTVLAVVLGPPISLRTGIIMTFVFIWSSRLGIFLFRMVLKAGEDKRFENIKKSFFKLLMTWTLQGLWVSFTVAAALAVITVEQPIVYSAFDWIGLIIGGLIWILGFSFEAVSDYQKNKFRSIPENKGKFIHTGLWSISRHPNYFGEITLWIGMALIALPSLESWRFIVLISPLWVFIQLIFISGVSMLEKSADKKWGGQEDYELYKRNTAIIIPWIRFRK